MLLGLLITVQGFETSRYLGFAYSADLRVRSMRLAQWLAIAIYLTFLALLTPVLGRAAETKGGAGILDVMTFVSAPLGIFVLVGALASQLSAAVADSIGSGGMMSEVTGRRLSMPQSFALAGSFSILVVWLTDPFEVVATASRAFAVYYALQCLLGWRVAHQTGQATRRRRIAFIAIGTTCVIAALTGAPAE